MTDVFTPEKRSEVMSRVRGRDTKPEKLVRSLIHRMGYRFRLHVGELPGRPDVVLPRHRKVVFVHGCFWHGHPSCKRAARPKSNREFWRAKIEANRKRDGRNIARLRELGWRVLVVWECQTRDVEALEATLRAFLDDPGEQGDPGEASGLSARDRLRAYFLANVGRVLTTHELAEVAGIREYARRIRELRTEEGYQILTHHDRADLKPGEYILVDTKPVPAFGREISNAQRVRILERNGYTCQMCGAGAGEPHPANPRKRARLVIHHKVPVEQGGTNDDDNLQVLCSYCNEGKGNLHIAPSGKTINFLSLIRRFSKKEQREVYEFLKRKFGDADDAS